MVLNHKCTFLLASGVLLQHIPFRRDLNDVFPRQVFDPAENLTFAAPGLLLIINTTECLKTIEYVND